jgi:uncharacterized protein (TIGR03084 family)
VDELLTALAAQHAELAELIDQCSSDDWERPTACAGWDVADVLLHLALTDELAIASARGELPPLAHGLMGSHEAGALSVDEAAAAQVAADRPAGGEAIRRRWHDASRGMLAAFDAADPHQRVTWVTNQLSVETLAATRLSECWIHTGDIATAVDVRLEPTGRLRHVARLAWRTLPYAFERADLKMHGPVALDLTGPSGERWRFDPDAPALTTIRGSAAEFCEVAARRVDAGATDLCGTGPDGESVLRVVRTYAL